MSSSAGGTSTGAWIARASLIAAFASLSVCSVYYFIAVYHAVTFAFELDYGEGIVWQQMRDIVAGRGYGQIAVFPGLVFHYPPLYHLLTAGLSHFSGLDQLAAGRFLSASSTVLTAVVIALTIKQMTSADGALRAAWICGLIGGLTVFSMVPIFNWSLFMRVDMAGFLFSFAGLYFGLRALDHGRLIHLAALCFVAAVFTKQTNIAAPIAVFATLLVLCPRTAFSGIATGLIIALAALVALIWQTDGGFLRHIISYNINRIELARLLMIRSIVGEHFLYLCAASFGAFHFVQRRKLKYRGLSWFEIREKLANSTGDAQYAMVAAYAVTASLVLLTIIKSGSSYNYFIEWMFLLSLFIGLALREAGLYAFNEGGTTVSINRAALIPLAISVQALILAAMPPWASWHWKPNRQAQLLSLSQMVRSTDKPVISDDMVILLRSGKPVLYEPAIFAELSSGHIWDQGPFIAKIRNRDFAFFITTDDRGSSLYDSRYNPDVADAIAAAYPKVRKIADLTVHFPAEDPRH